MYDDHPCSPRAAVEADGKVCISILHPPGVDQHNEFESADERWRPIIGIEQVLVSVMAMLGDPNINSPANIDAAVSEGAHIGWGRMAVGCRRALTTGTSNYTCISS